MNMKSENRFHEARKRAEIRRPSQAQAQGLVSVMSAVHGGGFFGLRPSGFFRPSDFELRISAWTQTAYP